MGNRCAKNGQNGIADEFFDEAVVAANLLSQGLEAAHHQASQFLRVELLGQTGEAHDIGE